MTSFYGYLKEGGFLNEEQLKAGLDEQSRVRNSTFYSALVRANILPEEQLLQLSSAFFKVKRVENAYQTNVDFAATEKVMGSITNAVAEKMFCIHLDGRMTFVVTDPENEIIRKKAATALSDEPEYAILSEKEFEILNQYQLTPRAISEQADQIKVGAKSDSESEKGSTSYLQQLLNMLIDAALDRRASDLHLQQMTPETAQIILRIDGKPHFFSEIKASVLANLRNRLKTLSGVGGEKLEDAVEGQIRAIHNGVPIDIRVNIVTTANGYDFCLRFIEADLRSLEELGLSEANYQRYLKLLHMTKGLVILCGPTGSGKTSLLYAGFKKLMPEYKRIYTIEDPVEIKLPGITQISVNKEKKQTYAGLFPSALRHDPDIIGIGETREIDVAHQVVQAANTGHLVFTTLHTNNSMGAISRLTTMGVDAYTVGDVLAAVIAQRLIRRVCTQCAEEYDLPSDHFWRKRYNLGDGKITLKRGRGCAYCSGTGYRGRIAVDEVLLNSPKVRSLIQRNATSTELEEQLREEGFEDYIKDGVDKALAGLTTFDEVDELYRDIEAIEHE